MDEKLFMALQHFGTMCAKRLSDALAQNQKEFQELIKNCSEDDIKIMHIHALSVNLLAVCSLFAKNPDQVEESLWKAIFSILADYEFNYEAEIGPSAKIFGEKVEEALKEEKANRLSLLTTETKTTVH